MFGPVRGWWPACAPLRMKGGTEFRFVTCDIHEALARARASAGARTMHVFSRRRS